MTETFSNSITQNIGLTFLDIYQAPDLADSNVSIILSIYICNKATTVTDITIAITDSTNTVLGYLASTVTIPVDGSWEAIANKIILKRGQKLQALASAVNSIDATVSCMEVT